MDYSDDTRESKGDRLSTYYGSMLVGDPEPLIRRKEEDIPPYEPYDAWVLAKDIEYLSSNTRNALFGLPNCRDIFRYFSAEEANEIMRKYREGQTEEDHTLEILNNIQELLRQCGKKVGRRELASFYRSLEDI